MRYLLGAAVALASAQPALAAGLHDESQTGRRSGAFAGATFRVGLDGRRSEEARAAARLRHKPHRRTARRVGPRPSASRVPASS
jgi:hypothetical protein